MANELFQWSRSALRLALGLSLGMTVRVAQAANTCPWMNEATASGLLGGDAIGNYQASSAGQAAVCTFTEHRDHATRVLRIQVETRPDASVRLRSMEDACRSDGRPLQAIGNEALVCADDRGGRLGEQVLGRVRDQIFTIRVSSSLKNDPTLTRDALQRLISTAAEQVAGNLF
jgi:hypothetical protein